MSKWQLLDYPNAREIGNPFAASLRQLLAGRPAYLLHDQVLFALTMETIAEKNDERRRFLLLEAVAAIGDAGQNDLARLRRGTPFRSDVIRLPRFPDPEATTQIGALLTERAGQAFLEEVHDRLHE